MSKIKVVIIDALANKSYDATVKDDVPVQDLVSKYVELLDLPKFDPAGHKMSYKLQHKNSGVLLNQYDTLANVEAKDGDVLRILHEITAG